MTPDRNKTLSTRRITAAVVLWLDERGFKPIETEALLISGWQADVAAVIEPTGGESVRLRVAPKPPKWKLWDSNPTLAREMQDAHDAAHNGLPCPVTALVEVKSSMTDLKKDPKWQRASPADLSFVAVPEQLVAAALAVVPDWWGVIRVTERGCRVMRWAVMKPVAMEQRLFTIYAIALCRDHRTRYKALRESEKQARQVRSYGVRIERWSQAVRAVTIIAKGGYGGWIQYSSVADVLSAERIGHVPESVMEKLNEIWGSVALSEAESARVSLLTQAM